ncbi:MAG: hypothetical protein ACTSUE_11850 [Promethearchaeota archaeon]
MLSEFNIITRTANTLGKKVKFLVEKGFKAANSNIIYIIKKNMKMWIKTHWNDAMMLSDLLTGIILEQNIEELRNNNNIKIDDNFITFFENFAQYAIHTIQNLCPGIILERTNSDKQLGNIITFLESYKNTIILNDMIYQISNLFQEWTKALMSEELGEFLANALIRKRNRNDERSGLARFMLTLMRDAMFITKRVSFFRFIASFMGDVSVSSQFKILCKLFEFTIIEKPIKKEDGFTYFAIQFNHNSDIKYQLLGRYKTRNCRLLNQEHYPKDHPNAGHMIGGVDILNIDETISFQQFLANDEYSNQDLFSHVFDLRTKLPGW